MTKNHTHAPWTRNGWEILGSDGSIVCKIIPWDNSGCREEDHDNANIIAVAPEMLEFIQYVVENSNETETVERAKQILGRL